jgi:hypothetical protein
MKKLFTVLALIAGLASGAGAALAETRVALVIGNDGYVTLPNLNNAGNDARGVAAKLKSLGFETMLHNNVGSQDLGRTLGTAGQDGCGFGVLCRPRYPTGWEELPCPV